MRLLVSGLIAVSIVSFGLAQSSPAPAPNPAPASIDPEAIRVRERMVLLTVSTVVLAERTYAASNGAFFDEIRCLTRPEECIPDLPPDAPPLLDPTHDWFEPQMGYERKFHPGPKPTPDEINQAKASPSSLKAFAFTATPLRPGETGTRAFCADSTGRMCFTPKGTEPPVKDGRCEPCKKLE